MSAFPLPWIPLWPETQRNITLFRMDSAYIACLQPHTSFDVTLVPQGLAKLPGYLNKYIFALLNIIRLHSHMHRIKSIQS
jgi:hypothetical protein